MRHQAHQAATTAACCLLLLQAAVLVPVADAKASTRVLKSVEDFEATVLQDERVWLVGFIHADDAAPNTLAAAAQELGTRVVVGIAEFKNVKELAYENNVRKRNCPQLRLFTTRSRNSVKLPWAADGAAIATATLAQLSENDVSEDGAIKKITLALGGAPEEL